MINRVKKLFEVLSRCNLASLGKIEPLETGFCKVCYVNRKLKGSEAFRPHNSRSFEGRAA